MIVGGDSGGDGVGLSEGMSFGGMFVFGLYQGKSPEGLVGVAAHASFDAGTRAGRTGKSIVQRQAAGRGGRFAPATKPRAARSHL